MDGHDLDTVVASLVHANTLDLIQGPIDLLFGAEDSCLYFSDDSGLLVENHGFDLAGVEDDDSENEHS